MTHARLEELLVTRATQALSSIEQRELDDLLQTEPDIDPHAFDWTAAAIDLAMTRLEAPFDETLRSRLETDALSWMLRTRRGAGNTVQVDENIEDASRTNAGGRSGIWLPWLAAAACLTLAVLAWLPNRSQDPRSLYSQMVDRPSVSRYAWEDAADTEVSGEIIWDAENNTGVMRFSGLPVNDPSQYQYQLWIFDDARQQYSENIAVSGGVFNVESTGEVFISVDPELPISSPSLFAVTTEPPGGVVKHNPDADPDRYRIILTAATS